MSYLSATFNASLVTTPSLVQTLYTQDAAPFATALGTLGVSGGLNPAMIASAFAAVAAWGMKPYGNVPHLPNQAAILAAPTIAAQDYVCLTYYLMQYLSQCAGVATNFLGWSGGAVGTHAQMIVSQGGQSLLLDPTVGLVGSVSYNTLAAGKPVPASSLQSFWDTYGGSASIAGFASTVYDAVLNGQYKPSDALYFFQSFTLFSNPLPPSTWPTPAAAATYQPTT